MGDWPLRRWAVALATAVATILFIGISTVLIPTPWFGREVPPTPWAWPVLIVTSALSGLVSATYVNRPGTAPRQGDEVPSRSGMVGGLLAYFAVGCPVCNKIALLALGASGAIRWFAPAQPFLAAAGVGLLGYALRRRLNGERACPLPQP
jgi:hypothetical protein